MTEIIDEIYVATPYYGTPFASALTCMRCGAMIDGNQYAPAPTPRQQHAAWHEQIDVPVADLQHREMVAVEAVERG